VIWRIGDRATFARFRSEGRRFRHGRLWVTWVPDPDAVPPGIAFAFARTVGNAPARNQLRRRLRAAFGDRADELPGGYYLVGAKSGAGDASFREVSEAVGAWCDRARRTS
jgi:ribonuclease P protein component